MLSVCLSDLDPTDWLSFQSQERRIHQRTDSCMLHLPPGAREGGGGGGNCQAERSLGLALGQVQVYFCTCHPHVMPALAGLMSQNCVRCDPLRGDGKETMSRICRVKRRRQGPGILLPHSQPFPSEVLRGVGEHLFLPWPGSLPVWGSGLQLGHSWCWLRLRSSDHCRERPSFLCLSRPSWSLLPALLGVAQAPPSDQFFRLDIT